MASFGNNEEMLAATNQHFIEFIDSQKRTQLEIRDLKESIFQYATNLKKDSNDATKEHAATLKKLTEQIKPAGSDAATYNPTSYNSGEKTSTETLKAIKDYLGNLPVIENIKENVKETAKGLWDEIKKIFVASALTMLALPFMGPVLDWFDKNFGTDLRSKFDKVTGPLAGYMDTMKWFVSTIGTNLMSFVGYLKTGVEGFSAWLKLLYDDPKQAVDQAWESIKNLGTTMSAKITDFFKNAGGIYSVIKEKMPIIIEDSLNGMKNFAEKSGLKLYYDEVVATVKRLGRELDPLIFSIQNTLHKVWDSINYVWSSDIIQTRITNFIEDMAEKMEDKASRIWNALIDTIGPLIDKTVNQIIIGLFGEKKYRYVEKIDPVTGDTYIKREETDEMDVSTLGSMLGQKERVQQAYTNIREIEQFQKEQREKQQAEKEAQKKERDQKAAEKEKTMQQTLKASEEKRKAAWNVDSMRRINEEALAADYRLQSLPKSFTDFTRGLTLVGPTQQATEALNKSSAVLTDALREWVKIQKESLQSPTIIAPPANNESSSVVPINTPDLLRGQRSNYLGNRAVSLGGSISLQL